MQLSKGIAIAVQTKIDMQLSNRIEIAMQNNNLIAIAMQQRVDTS